MNNNTTHKFETRNLAYFPDIAKHFFAPISHQPWAMLLRSASSNHPDSRFDILVANPLVKLETKGKQTKISKDNITSLSNDDPFDLIKHQLKCEFPPIEPIEDIPFTGGALGYFSYDLGRRIESLPKQATHDIHIPEMAVGIYQWALIADHKSQKATLVGFNLEKNHRWLIKQKAESVENFALISNWKSNMSKDEYRNKIDAVHDYLLSGDCYQINLAQRYSAKYQGSEWNAYLSLEESNQAPFSAFIQTDNASILSVSPERFLQLDDRHIETKPIKGTRPRSRDIVTDRAVSEELKSAEKDQAENLMIVDLLRNDIGKVAQPGSVSVPKLFEIESFPAVHHLVSTVQAKLGDQYQATDLLKACFPGGSITGAPKVRAMEIIEELEPHRRSTYCGSIGYISCCGKMDTSITIRTLVTHENQIHAWAGGGIVADSQWEAEYQETLDKLSRILPVLKKESKIDE